MEVRMTSDKKTRLNSKHPNSLLNLRNSIFREYALICLLRMYDISMNNKSIKENLTEKWNMYVNSYDS